MKGLNACKSFNNMGPATVSAPCGLSHHQPCPDHRSLPEVDEIHVPNRVTANPAVTSRRHTSVPVPLHGTRHVHHGAWGLGPGASYLRSSTAHADTPFCHSKRDGGGWRELAGMGRKGVSVKEACMWCGASCDSEVTHQATCGPPDMWCGASCDSPVLHVVRRVM